MKKGIDVWSDQFKQADGTYVIDDEMCDDVIELFCARLNFCGCGVPKLALHHVLWILEIFKIYDLNDNGGNVARQEMIDAYGGDGAAYFYWYWLDRLDLTTHGVGVPGILTQDGYLIIEELDSLLNKENNDE